MTISHSPARRRGASTLALAFALSAPALAAPVLAHAADAGSDDPGNHEVGELVVTGSYTTDSQLGSATGLNLSLRETPQSVTVMTAQRMEDQNIRSLSDVVDNAAGVSAKAFDSSRNGFSARGFAIDNYQIDGIPVQWDSAYSAGESDIDVTLYDRVEIVRGATGLMTGAGNPSASINLIRKHADSARPTGWVAVSGGSWSNWSVSGDLQTPLTADGKVRARVVAKYADGDSFVDLLHNRTAVLYGVIDADPTENTHLSVGASYQDNKPRGSLWGGLPVWYADGARTNWSRSKTIGADWTTWPSQDATYFATLTQNLNANWSVKLYGNYTDNSSDMRLLYLSGQPDKTTGLGLSAFPARYDGRLAQADLGVRVNGKYQLFGREQEVTFGASYARQTLNFYSYAASNVAAVGDFNAWDGSYPEPTWSSARSHDVDERTQQWGAYGATHISLTDQLKVVLGGRLASWERSGLSYGTPADFSAKNQFLPYAGALFDVTSNHTLYVSYTKIFEPQDYQDKNGDFLPAVTGVNYEAGLKSSFFGGRLNTAISGFHIVQDNLAQIDPGQIVPGSINQAYVAAKGAHSNGFELEANGNVTPNWAVSVNYTQFHATDASGARVNTLFPEQLLRLFTSYRFDGMLEGLTVGGGVNWEGLSYTDTTNPITNAAERLKVEPYAVVNLMARYQINKHLSAQVNIENLGDKTYYSQIGFYNQLAYGAPRNATVTLRYQY